MGLSNSARRDIGRSMRNYHAYSNTSMIPEEYQGTHKYCSHCSGLVANEDWVNSSKYCDTCVKVRKEQTRIYGSPLKD